MDVDFDVQDALALVRPQLKLLGTLEEAGAAFAEACKEQYQASAMDNAADTLEDERDELNDDGEEGQRTPPVDKSSGDEADMADDDQLSTPDTGSVREEDDDEEHIVVVRPEDERDPEADAEFDRELAKMMAEGLETRKIEKRPLLDVTLPMRRAQRDNVADEEDQDGLGNTIKFSLLSKKGNRPQVRGHDTRKAYDGAHANAETFRHEPSIYPPTPISPSPCALNRKLSVPSNNASRGLSSTMILCVTTTTTLQTVYMQFSFNQTPISVIDVPQPRTWSAVTRIMYMRLSNDPQANPLQEARTTTVGPNLNKARA